MVQRAAGTTGVTVEGFRQIMRDSLPFAAAFGAEIIEMGEGRAVAALPFKSDFLRPGGTIGGPLLMMLADLVVYAAVLSAIGPVELAVTTSLTINFLRKPALFTQGDGEMVAHVVATYSIPPRHRR